MFELSVSNQARASLCTGLLVQYADQCSPWVQRNYKRPYDLCSDIVLLFYGQWLCMTGNKHRLTARPRPV